MTTRYLINCREVRVDLDPDVYLAIYLYKGNYRIDIIKNLNEQVRNRYGIYHIMAINMSTWKTVFDIPFFENRLAKNENKIFD